jgi:hypothetical protein
MNGGLTVGVGDSVGSVGCVGSVPAGGLGIGSSSIAYHFHKNEKGVVSLSLELWLLEVLSEPCWQKVGFDVIIWEELTLFL